MKKPVSEHALIQRINRVLAHDGRRLHKNRTPRPPIGQYYVVIENANAILSHHQNVDLERFGRKLAVLKPYEELRD